MSAEENRAIIRRFGQVWGKGSLAPVDELADPALSVHYPTLGETLHGPEAFKQFLKQFHDAFPDANITFDDEIAEGDKVVVRWTLRGTHHGELMSIQPTGKKIAFTGITIYSALRLREWTC
jgi:ketosteroid isomerase-like protein